MTITRFSPSPTGYLHIGNIRTALVNYLFAKKHKGKIYLRIDDTDITRSESKYTETIKEDLLWLGIKWDKYFQQSDNLAKYNEIKEKLEKLGLIYPCFESEEELQIQRKIQTSRGIPPIYDRNSLNLSEQEITKKSSSGIKPYYRFKLSDNQIKWKDGVKGEISFPSRTFSDPVVVRANGTPTYTFCSVIDDIDHNITHIIRGEDHISNTAVQIQIFLALTKKLPKFSHLSLMKTKDEEMSKRIGGYEIKKLRQEGFDPMSINSFLANIGTSNNIIACKDFDKLIEGFSLKKHSHSSVNYVRKDLEILNHKLISQRSFQEIEPFLHNLEITDISSQFWEMVKKNIDNYNQLLQWKEVFKEDYKIDKLTDKKEFLEMAASLLPDQINEESFKSWINELSIKSNQKGKELYHPLRLAITNYDSGPELSKIIILLGSKIVKQRLCQ